jgi:hypothetical protein
MKKPKSGVSVSKLQVLEAISDHISIKLLDEIAKNTTTSDSHMQKLNISRKQYYDRSSRLLKTDLVKLVDGKFTLTAFGKLVYHAELKISRAFHCASELRMIDAIKSHSGLSDAEQKNLIDRIIEDSEIKKLIS